MNKTKVAGLALGFGLAVMAAGSMKKGDPTPAYDTNPRPRAPLAEHQPSRRSPTRTTATPRPQHGYTTQDVVDSYCETILLYVPEADGDCELALEMLEEGDVDPLDEVDD